MSLIAAGNRNFTSLIIGALMMHSLVSQATDFSADPHPGQFGTSNVTTTNVYENMIDKPDKAEKSDGLTFGKDYIIVPLPVQNPTFGAGLVLGGAYFYSQTDKQKARQPASFTGVAASYTNSDSYAVGLLQQNYWDNNNWRFTGIASYLDLRLQINDPTSTEKNNTDWLLNGELIQGSIYRKLAEHWYIGLLARYINFTQSLDFNAPVGGLFVTDTNSQSGSLGLIFERDSRDIPTNAYTGSLLSIKLIENQLKANDTSSYQSYLIRYRSYHHVAAPVVLAWDVNACEKSANFPLWDACLLKLRGFTATRYMSKNSASAQVESRWKFYKRWGAVAFAGVGYVGESFGGIVDDETVPSYGVGLRWMVSDSKRINLRLDYARSTDSDAWYLSAAEYF